MAKPGLGKSVRFDWFFLGRDFAVRTVSNGPSRVFLFLQPKRRGKMWILSFFIAKLPEKAKRIEILVRFQRWMKKKNILRERSVLSWTSGNFWCRKWKWRKVQTQTRRLLLIWTLFSATSKLMVWKMRQMKAYLRPSLTTFCRNLFECTEAKRRRVRAVDSFQFSALYKLTAILRRNTHLRSQGQWVRKIRKVLSAKQKSLVLTWARQRKQTASCSGHRRRRRGCPFFFKFEFGDPNPVALQRTVWWFLYNTSVSEQENISQAIRYCLPPLQFLQVETKHSIHRQGHIPNISW